MVRAVQRFVVTAQTSPELDSSLSATLEERAKASKVWEFIIQLWSQAPIQGMLTYSSGHHDVSVWPVMAKHTVAWMLTPRMGMGEGLGSGERSSEDCLCHESQVPSTALSMRITQEGGENSDSWPCCLIL